MVEGVFLLGLEEVAPANFPRPAAVATGLRARVALERQERLMAALCKRVPRELADAQSEAMRKSGIYYWFDETDMRKGKALIVGPAGTPYAHCPLLFSFQLPSDYPFNPPAVQILTSDGQTRFHPNLYVGGKVCLSILGTWSGPKWSAVMTVSTVLSSIQSLLEENPITNEPGWEKYTLGEPRAKSYAELVEARLIALCFRDLLRWRRGETPPAWVEFQDVLDEIGERLIQQLAKRIEAGAAAGEKTYTNVPYSMQGTTEWIPLRHLWSVAAGAAIPNGTKIE